MSINMQSKKFSGSHREMGLQQGQEYAAMLRRGMGVFKSLEAVMLIKPRLMPAGLFLRIAGFIARKKFDRLLETHAPRQRERLLGMAEGSGVPSWFLYFVFASEIVMGENDFEVPLACGCTTIAAQGSLTSSGHVTVARNFDFASFVLPFLCARVNEPTGLMASRDITAMPLPGTFNGYNEEGVFIATNEAFPVAPGIRDMGLPASIIIQEALETCNTVQEVIDLFKKVPRGSCNIITVADRSGEMVSLEYTSKDIHVVGPDPGEPFIVATNHYVSPGLVEIDLPRDAVFGKKAPRSLQGVCINETSFVRREVARARVQALKEEIAGSEASPKAGVEWFTALLSDHSAGEAGRGGMNTLCHHDPENITASSMVVDLETLEMWACFGNPCEREFEPVEVPASKNGRGS